MKWERLSSKHVNEISDYVFAEENDICYRIDNILGVCNIKDDVNNITVESLFNSPLTMRNVMNFIYVLYIVHGIEYIQVKPDRKWPILNRVKAYINNNIYYIRLEDNIKLIRKEMSH